MDSSVGSDSYYGASAGSDSFYSYGAASDEANRLRQQMESIEQTLAAAPRIALDISIPDVLPGRYLHLTSIAQIDAYEMCLEYEIVPMYEAPSRANAEESRAFGPHGWLLSGRDDLGNVYIDLGGTYGVPPNGVLADGERDLRPAPPVEASWLEIAIHTDGDTDSFDSAAYVFKLPLPLVPAVDSWQI